MARIGRCVARGLGAGLALALLVAPSGPAAAHARLVGSSPAAGTTVETAPDEVVIELDAKPATIEGDPLQVYAPDGRRVDARDPHVGRQGRRLAVTLDPRQPLPSGEYQVAYRVVSADSHVISGRLSFTVRLPSPAGAAPGVASAPADDPGAGSHRLVAGGRLDPRPRLVAAGGLVLASLTLLLRALWALWSLWRRPAPRPAPTGARSPSRRHRDRHRPRPDRRHTTAHGRAHGHRVPPRVGPDRDDEAFWAGPGRGRAHRRAPVPSGAAWWSAPEDDGWP